ncbi:MAG: GNAT family N-acetyltransferase [Rhodospirillaceae bacterium]|jgi:acetyltransferase|nr:GNAT family N-acetyltransferase [Rhodospirillaceae bacterium]MBT5243244.1 GNAT family N-acetyltransferase [Rhodospirillaceae bacterium]MBT5563972.1 GNAT family N-acetyltransferase [Rhodospirillaceae bacterium]MBT6240824.1 GNAT family N-acetyltransferase [Rhodospirillaceae bacterium]
MTNRPYPIELEEIIHLEDGSLILLRPIRPDDETDHYAFLDKLTPEDIRFRFFGKIGEMSHDQMYGLTHIDYDNHMAFIATTNRQDGGHETLGVVRTIADPADGIAEFAIVVRSDFKEHGLGGKLLLKIISYCRSHGVKILVGYVMPDNIRMLHFSRDLGFKIHHRIEEGDVEVVLHL